MSKMKLSLVASALVGAVVFTAPTLAADPLEQLHSAEQKIHKAAAKSQTKINAIQEQTTELMFEYRDVVAETEINKVYNDHVAKLVAAQNDEIKSLEDLETWVTMEDFEVTGYQCHEPIQYPFSV